MLVEKSEDGLESRQRRGAGEQRGVIIVVAYGQVSHTKISLELVEKNQRAARSGHCAVDGLGSLDRNGSWRPSGGSGSFPIISFVFGFILK